MFFFGLMFFGIDCEMLLVDLCFFGFLVAVCEAPCGIIGTGLQENNSLHVTCLFLALSPINHLINPATCVYLGN